MRKAAGFIGAPLNRVCNAWPSEGLEIASASRTRSSAVSAVM
ncbi:hypothetical protein [Streptomyces sp. MK37H]|nr:hypothetical protein [Streptomyces sp. MK37H]